jgi:isoamylase
VLLDPYGRLVAIPRRYDRTAAMRPGENFAQSLNCVVVDTTTYDWEGDKPLNRSFFGTVICELHVAGFTRRPNSGVAAEKRGTYAGMIEKIPYLVDLGITAVELLPVFQFEMVFASTWPRSWRATEPDECWTIRPRSGASRPIQS